MVLSVFYYSFSVSYLNARDEAEAEAKENEIQRAFQVSQIDVNSIFQKYVSFNQSNEFLNW